MLRLEDWMSYSSSDVLYPPVSFIAESLIEFIATRASRLAFILSSISARRARDFRHCSCVLSPSLSSPSEFSVEEDGEVSEQYWFQSGVKSDMYRFV